MPKMKSHSGAKKRFKLTGTGKVSRRSKNLNHFLEKKSSRRKRRLSGDSIMSPADTPRAKRLLSS
ncbi:MAG: 50S ribosomal protein L35 [Acidimicrobiia bacterium]|nr:50S ribosomal protein L35 [Acidimicrobiia bacterium]MDH4364932.1 50S ribosomal protein L35 [Acidimicrobiia bacterium]